MTQDETVSILPKHVRWVVFGCIIVLVIAMAYYGYNVTKKYNQIVDQFDDYRGYVERYYGVPSYQVVLQDMSGNGGRWSEPIWANA